METKPLSSVNFAPYNPRTISDHDFKALQRSMSTFGDIGSVVLNLTTGNLVAGHQRVRSILGGVGKDAQITITNKYETPDKYGTVAEGYITVPGSTLKFPYREVRWNENTEKAANVAANRISGDWDEEMLAELDQQLKELENGEALLALTGQTEDEVKKLLGLDEQEKSSDDETSGNRMSFRFNEEQYQTVEKALAVLKSQKNLQNEPNPDIDSSALYYICETFLSSQPQADII